MLKLQHFITIVTLKGLTYKPFPQTTYKILPNWAISQQPVQCHNITHISYQFHEINLLYKNVRNNIYYFVDHSSVNKVSKGLEVDSAFLVSSKNPLDAFSLLDFLSWIIDSSVSVQYFPCFTGLSATINLCPSRLLSEKPAQTEDNHEWELGQLYTKVWILVVFCFFVCEGKNIYFSILI